MKLMVLGKREALMRILPGVIITVLLIKIPVFASSYSVDSSRSPDDKEMRSVTTDDIRKLKVYGMFVSSVEFVSKDAAGKIFIFERGKLVVSPEINNSDRKFIFDTISKLKDYNIHVSSLEYVYGKNKSRDKYLNKEDALDNKLAFEKGKLKMYFPKTMQWEKVEGERDRLLGWLEVLNDQELFVSAFSCSYNVPLKFKDGHLTLPFASMQ